MSQLSSFYGVLLSIQFTVFGIISAAIFVLIQVLHSSLPRHSLWPLFNKKLISSLILSLITVLATAVSGVLLALPRHDFLSHWNFGLRHLLMSQWTPITLMLLTMLSASCVAWIVFRNFSVLHPQRLLLQIQSTLETEDIRLFLFKQYGINLPSSSSDLKSIPDDIKEKLFQSLEVDPSDLSDEDKEYIEKSIAEDKARFNEDCIRFVELKTKAEKAQDPLDLVSAISVTAIKASDLQTLKEVTSTVRVMTDRLFSSIPPISPSPWDPDKEIASLWTKYVCQFVSAQLEIAYKEGLPSMAIHLMEVTNDCALAISKYRHYQSMFPVMSCWKKEAGKAIGENKLLFIWVMKRYEDLGFAALEQELVDISNQIFRDLGWLGETLFNTIEFKDKPLMPNREYSTEQEELVEVLLRFGSEYASKYPTAYPLIYFDALHVVFLKLIKVRALTLKSKELEQALLACISKIASFVEPALRAGNEDGAALAVLRLGQWYEALNNEGLKDAAADAIDSLTTAACIAVQFDKSLVRSDLLSGSIEDHISKLLINSPYYDSVESAIKEGVMKSTYGPNHQRVWDFVRRLGKRMKTNFGYRFDWTTGAVYPKEGPRRP